MKFFQRLSLFLALFSTFLLLSIQALLANEVCPPLSEMTQTLEARNKTLKTFALQIEHLLAGEIVKDLLPSALFIVNISNEADIAKRMKELTEEIAKNLPERLSEHPLFKCLDDKHDSLKNLLTSVVQNERHIEELRLQFLSLATEKRQSLLNLQEQAALHLKNINKLELEKQEAKERAESADKAVKKAQDSVEENSNEDFKELAGARILLEQTRKNIANQTISWTEELKYLATLSKEYSRQLSSVTATLDKKETQSKNLLSEYNKATDIWRNLLNQLFKRNLDNISLPSLPVPPEKLLTQYQDKQEARDYLSSFEHAKRELNELEELKKQIDFEVKNNQYRLILLAGKIRAQFIAELDLRKDVNIFKLSNASLADVIREIRLIPYRPSVIAKNFISDIKETISDGLSGWLSLLERLFLLLLFIATPFFTYWLMQKSSTKIDHLRTWLIKAGKNNSFYLKLALWIYRLNRYLPSAMLYLATYSAAIVIKGTELESLKEILPYFEYYFLYQIFRIALKQAAIGLSEYSYLKIEATEISQKIEKSGQFIGLYFLIAFYILEATEAAARQALFYHYVSNLILFFTPIILAISANWWKNEILHANSIVTPDFLAPKIDRLLRTRFSFFICLPALILIIFSILGKKIFSYAVKMDSAKRVSAQLFRRKLESSAKQYEERGENQNIDSTYLHLFHEGPPQEKTLIISAKNIPLRDIKNDIDQWLDGSHDEHTIAIQGEKGIGKSSILTFIDFHYKDLNKIKISVSNKITCQKEFYHFLSQLFPEHSLNSLSDIVALDKKIPKTLLLIDEGQNLFLAKRGGFSAFHLLNSIFNLRTENLFWCMTFNRYSWAYLNAVTGGSQFFRKIYSIKQWSDKDIKEMIMARHHYSGLKLEFDPIIYTIGHQTQRDEIEYIQDRFFEMLWEQARGNPRAALALWVSALQQADPQTIKVGLPEESPSKPLEGLTDEEIFVIAGIIRHENLTVNEAVEVCNLSERVVRHAVRVGLERGFLARSQESGRYRVEPLWQGPLTSQLISKNFVY
jgi:hypothetical protein